MQINSLLHHVFTQKQWQVQWHFHTIFQDWPSIAGNEISVHAYPAVIRNNTLWIHTDSSAWMHHLQLLKPDLLNRINSVLKDHPLGDIRFLLRETKLPANEIETSLPAPRQLEDDAVEYFYQVTSCLEDDKSRQALRNLWKRFQQNA